MISDVQMPGPNGYELLSSIKRLRPDLPVVLMTAYGTVAQAVAAMREGATDYIVKPFDAQALIEMARRQLAHARRAERAGRRRSGVEAPGGAGAQDRARTMPRCSSPARAAPARKCMRASSATTRRAPHAPFVAINCAAIPENMLEATLFGYEKGAFTGAQAAHAGKFEQAQGGTLLLDEISEMDLGLQAKILRVLQEREVERLGSTRTISLDVRVIATSNRDLPEEVRAGALSRRSVLPAQCDVAAAAAAARAARRHPAAGAARHAGLRARRTGRA